MSYQALYREWRPPSFADMVHQPHVKQTLQNAILRKQVAHAYLFCGPRGTGKTSAAKILAKAVNCLHPNGADPCNQCEACVSINRGSNVDVEEIDAASNRGVEEIRQLRDKVQYAPASLKKKVYIVDEVHMLTPEAFNALLKTLEEPPSHVLFVLATTEVHKIPETIISRCQRFDFRRIPEGVIVDRLWQICEAKGWKAHDDALWHIASAADGGLRDALGLLEQTAAYGNEEITADNAAHVIGGVSTAELTQLLDAATKADVLAVLNLVSKWYSGGKDTGRILAELLALLRNVFVVKLSAQAEGIPNYDVLVDVAKSTSVHWLLASVRQLGEVYTQLRYVDQPRIALEAALIGLSAMDTVDNHPEPASAPAAHRGRVVDEKNELARRPTAAQPTAEQAVTEQPEHKPESIAKEAEVPSASVDREAANASDRGSKNPKKTSQRRKIEVLQELTKQASPEVLSTIRAAWDDILAQTKSQKIQTYAWLMGGTPVLATADQVVVAFRVQVHRDNVMKQDERKIIEDSVESVVGYPIRFQAILQADWDAFSQAVETVPPAPIANEHNFVDDVVKIFGKEIVRIRQED